MTRRQFLSSALAAVSVGAAYPCVVEPRWLSLTRPQVELQRARLAEPIRLLHLSDLHFSWSVPASFIDSAFDLGLAQKPDLICITGDFITAKEDLRPASYRTVLSRLAKTAPTFAVLGNHDGGCWAEGYGGYTNHNGLDKLLEECGIELLHNRCVNVKIRSAELTVVGVGDLWAKEIDAPRAFAQADPGRPIVLLSHNPDSKDVLAQHTWDLMLSGHTHGGQVVIPLVGPPFAPVRDKRYVAGLAPWGERQIHVSRGVGNIKGVRFCCRPEVNLLEIRQASRPARPIEI